MKTETYSYARAHRRAAKSYQYRMRELKLCTRCGAEPLESRWLGKECLRKQRDQKRQLKQ